MLIRQVHFLSSHGDSYFAPYLYIYTHIMIIYIDMWDLFWHNSNVFLFKPASTARPMQIDQVQVGTVKIQPVWLVELKHIERIQPQQDQQRNQHSFFNSHVIDMSLQ